MRIILASQSPRRKELLEMITKNYEVIVSHVDETFEEGLTVLEQSKRLAYRKAKKVFEETDGDRIVIGSDTIVVQKDQVFEKPRDRYDAICMIKKLQNNTHQVITSLAVLVQEKNQYQEYIEVDTTKIHIKKMSDKEITHWIDSGKCFDKAGAYAIQSEFSVYIDEMVGNYFSVMGLPIHKLYDILKKYHINEK